MYYFAYGSNMLHSQMRERCPSSNFLKCVFLKGHRFVYDGYSTTRQGAVANIIETKNNKNLVYGGLFKINEDNLAALDCYEGYHQGIYDKKEVEVYDLNEKKYRATTYFRIGKKQGNPHNDYREIVLKGARDCGLPEDYINKHL